MYSKYCEVSQKVRLWDHDLDLLFDLGINTNFYGLHLMKKYWVDLDEVYECCLKHTDDPEIMKSLSDKEMEQFYNQIIFCQFAWEPESAFEVYCWNHKLCYESWLDR